MRMRIVVIGSTGHVGGYLVPRLVQAGHEVVAISRGEHRPYREDPSWSLVERVFTDRDADDAAGTFGDRVAALNPDVVVDMVCFTESSARQLVGALRGSGALLVSCGTIWVHGTLTEVPAQESDPFSPWGEYGIGKAHLERYLLAQSGEPGGVPSIVLRPGHISGPGWRIINPIANLDLDVWEKLSTGRELLLPGCGLETVHHVHADDVAQAFALAVESPLGAIGESFNVVSERALTLRGFAEAAAAWFGREAVLRFVGMGEFRSSLDPESAEISAAHIERSHSMSIAKARTLLGYAPRYTSLTAAREAVDWLAADGQIVLAS